MKKISNKRNFLGYLFAGLTAILVLFVIPFILTNRAEGILKTQYQYLIDNPGNPPQDRFYVAINYLDLAQSFPGFGKKSSESKNRAIFAFYDSYMEQCDIIKMECIELKLFEFKKQQDSLLKIIDKIPDEILLKNFQTNYNKYEKELYDSLWIKGISPEKQQRFCSSWGKFFKQVSIIFETKCDICEKQISN